MNTKLYLVGVFDGEGTITGTKDKRNNVYSLRIAVSMANMEVILMFLKTWGGKFYLKPSKGRALYSWHLNKSSSIILFLEYLIKYTVIKKEQAKIGLEVAREIYDCSKRKGNGRISRGRSFLTKEIKLLRENKMIRLKSFNYQPLK